MDWAQQNEKLIEEVVAIEQSYLNAVEAYTIGAPWDWGRFLCNGPGGVNSNLHDDQRLLAAGSMFATPTLAASSPISS